MRHMLSSVGSQPFKTDQSRAGGRMGTSIKGANTGEVHIEASPAEERMFNSYEVARLWREIVGDMPDAEELQFTADIFQAGDAINVVLTGADFEQLQAAAEWLKQELAKFTGVIDIADSFRQGKEEVQLKINPEAEALGLTKFRPGTTGAAGFYGDEVQRLQRGRDDVKVMIRYPRDERRSLANLEQMRVRLPGGNEVPFTDVAHVTYGRGYESIRRIDRRRSFNVTADVDAAAGNTRRSTGNLKPNYSQQCSWNFPASTGHSRAKKASRPRPLPAKNISTSSR
ncbi:MAG: hypothetical protein CM1200mP29_06670 [Verrucomicrobiota bacterium]|nr:MAG: hypothetical protein CM1200mP29_06670 [Verrucomicrobiota bacterium]